MKKLRSIAIASILAAAGSAAAADFAHPSITETGTEYHGAEYRRLDGKLARVDSWAQGGNVVTQGVARPADDFEYLGGDTGWSLRPHRYELAGGRYKHADDADHARPGNASSTAGALSLPDPGA